MERNTLVGEGYKLELERYGLQILASVGATSSHQHTARNVLLEFNIFIKEEV